MAAFAPLEYDVTTTNIHTALVAAMRDICKLGIGKTSQASAGGANYRYRGIDAAMNEMSPIFVNNGITVTPRYSELTTVERVRGAPADGKFSRVVTVKGSFTFAAADGSFVTAEAYGESIDTGDKATIKAQTVAFRTVLFQQFIVPLVSMDSELDNDGAEDAPPLPLEARRYAEQGVASYEKFFKGLTNDGRKELAIHHQALKDIAQAADAVPHG